VLLIFFIFFFSSRRRHTRLQGDWSSDVCSSDLIRGSLIDGLLEEVIECEPFPELEAQIAGAKLPRPFQAHLVQQNAGYLRIILRSEERRVGKECRSRWSPYH